MKISYSGALKTLVYCLSLMLLGCNSKSENKAEALKANFKPNILFILVDDLGYHDLGVTGSTFYETPNVNKLANEGMIFTQGYAASRVCSPSRASIMTGKFTARHGITDFIGAKVGEDWRNKNRFDKMLPANYVQSLPKEDITIAEAFKNNGYNTFFAGKWHLGGEGSHPENHGFVINKGGYYRGMPKAGFFAPWENPKLKSNHTGENLTIRLAEETADFIKQQKDSAFFAFLSFYAVHSPIQTTETKWNKYRNKTDSLELDPSGYKMERVLPIRQVQDNPIYGGLVETMDDAVGIVLKALKDSGLDKNTIVIFTSDNGGVASGDNYSTSNLPLRGGKGYQWEGGIREPFFIKVPWLENKGATTELPVINTDFYPTLLDLANVPLIPEQHIDGISLKPLLEGEILDVNRPLYWHYPHYGNQGGEPSSIIQEDGWKLIHYWEDGREELFKLPSSENDNLNVIAQYPELSETLSKKLLTWLENINAKYPTKDTKYDTSKAKSRYLNTINKKWPSLENQRLEVLSKDFQPNENWWKSKVTVD